MQQIVQTIKRDIEKGRVQKNEKLPSINEFHQQYKVARDTIEKAYRELKKQGYVESVASNGYFAVGKKETRLKILLIFNKLSSYKKIIYDSFLETLGDKAKVDLQIHHYDPRLLKEIIENNLGKYHYYVVMPHFFLNADLKACLKILRMIPGNELVILDKQMPGLNSNSIEVYQDFKQDIYVALSSANELLSKYKKINLLLEESSHHPMEIIDGAKQYCEEHAKTFSVNDNAQKTIIKKGTVYISTTEDDLGIIIKKVRLSGLQLGKDVGIISFNETILKELLDITVITTDFKEMGKTVAAGILGRNTGKWSNPFYMIRRGSL